MSTQNLNMEHEQADLHLQVTNLDNIPSEEVIDHHPAGSTSCVDETLACSRLGGEVTPYQGLEDGVASVGHHTAVTLHLGT